jgi:hypothetical protein
MDIGTWIKLGAVQGILYMLNVLAENLLNLQIPFKELVVPIIAAGISAIASWIRNQYQSATAHKLSRATRTGEPPLFARLFGV